MYDGHTRIYMELNHAEQQPRPQTQVNRANRMKKLGVMYLNAPHET